MSNQDKTPQALGYRFPAEWEPQEAVWFAWPTRADLWDGVLAKVREQMAALYVLAARFQKVRVLCPKIAQPQLRHLIKQAGGETNIERFDYETDDVWCRDFGPLFLLSADDSHVSISDWAYNAWGNKFPLHKKDNLASQWIAREFGLRRFACDTVLEGGAIESNGAGKVLTTEVVLLNPNRNGVASKEEVEKLLSEGLGVVEVLWLGDGLVGDDTDGHIDNLARFFKADGILMAESTDPQDENYPVLAENIRRVREYRTLGGGRYDIITVPLPDPIYAGGERLAASYLNFLVLNGAVLVPTYGQPARDESAMKIIGACYPGREIVGFDCRDIVREGGAIHCLSQHQPAVRGGGKS
jgi:agmatine deiminase